MKKKIVIRSIIIFLLLVEGISLYILYKPNDKTELLETIKINNNNFTNKKNMISIQIQNDNDYDYHEAEDKAKWPDKNIYTYAGSTCINKDGTEINAAGIISFDELEYTAEIQTKQTVYCTLYFTKGKPALQVLKNKGGSKFNSTSAVFGLFRFNGTTTDVAEGNLNNYICFGTTNIATCTGDKQTYMYRIIGITDNSATNTALGLEANQLKIIRTHPPVISQRWTTNGSLQWDGSDAQKYLNGAFLTTDKVKWKDILWEELIDEVYWYVGNNLNNSSTTETTTKSTDVYKVGLMYRSDFVNSGTQDTKNWLLMMNGTNESKTKYSQTSEWTMSPAGNVQTNYYTYENVVWALPYTAVLAYWGLGATAAIRPVYYLKSNVTLAGEGTETSPFIITSKY